ncbi:hypothetical protein BJ742DRAFT_681886, partial [Cladochytrium replicatum]
LLGIIADDRKMLGFFPVEHFERIHVRTIAFVHGTDMNPYKVKGEFTGVSQVEKFELKEEEYEKRSGLKWYLIDHLKIRSPMICMIFRVASSEEGREASDSIKVRDRCQGETLGKRRGVVRFVGINTSLKPGNWVGAEYDEPLGKTQ